LSHDTIVLIAGCLLWVFGFICGILMERNNAKKGAPSTSTNSKNTQCTCDYDGDKNIVVVYCGSCSGIVE